VIACGTNPQGSSVALPIVTSPKSSGALATSPVRIPESASVAQTSATRASAIRTLRRHERLASSASQTAMTVRDLHDLHAEEERKRRALLPEFEGAVEHDRHGR
jgi:hypothetical protein